MTDTQDDPDVGAADIRKHMFVELLLKRGAGDGNPEHRLDPAAEAYGGIGDPYHRVISMDKLLNGPEGFSYQLLITIYEGGWSTVLKCFLSDIYDAALSSNDGERVRSGTRFIALIHELERLRDEENKEDPVLALYFGEKARTVNEAIQSVIIASGSLVSDGAEASWRLLKESENKRPQN